MGRLTRVRWHVLAGIVLAAGVGTAPLAQPAASGDLFTGVGLSADEAGRARAGQAAVRVLAPNADNEIGVAGAIRIRGDLERLVAWLQNIDDFRRAAGTENVGRFGRPARPEDFAAAAAAGVDVAGLRRCRPDDCDIRMPAAYVERFSRDVPWGTPGDAAAAATLARQLLAEYAAAYQAGGDAALGAHHDQRSPHAVAAEFQDLLRRATTIWSFAYPFARYLETFPSERPADVEERFYWTRESGTRQMLTTLHHLVLQRLPDRSVRLADKQFYASRDLDAALLVGQATPTPEGDRFDLVVSIRARSARLTGMAARVLRGRIERELSETLAMYLDWLQRNYALG